MSRAYSFETAEQMTADLGGLYKAFAENAGYADPQGLLKLAHTQFEFRMGRAREETNWDMGPDLSDAQKHATLELANRWGMLTTTEPEQPFDSVVVLGAHSDSLAPRVMHTAQILRESGVFASLVALTCTRPIHPLERVSSAAIKTELDLAVDLLQKATHQSIEIDTITPLHISDRSRKVEEDAVVYAGHLGSTALTLLSGSRPLNASRATTLSTLEDFVYYLGSDRSPLLFITTSLHLPYQKLQIAHQMRMVPHEVIGVAHPDVADATPQSPDSTYRMLLQEIGATIKNGLSTNLLQDDQERLTITDRNAWTLVARKLVEVHLGLVDPDAISAEDMAVFRSDPDGSYWSLYDFAGNHAAYLCERFGISPES